MSADEITELADQIVEDLFTDGLGEVASRLVLEVGEKVPGQGPGWCKGAVRDRIINHLTAHELNEPTQRQLEATEAG